ncbi:MAG TPA: selenium cofactor biosynthesis protein YqeC [Dehalococcoidia bacterium]|nr:selenium cofactor biosynthesis protein YqeC [Dehalococcoidia bacterium]
MDLSEAFALGPRERLAIVGGGGKTTILFRLAAEAVAAGRTAVVGGTTRFTPPRAGYAPPLLIVGEHDDLRPAVAAALRESPARTIATGKGDKGRWLPLSAAQAEALAALPEIALLALEADGSRNRPFKAPGEGEPVIPDAMTVVLAVVGLDVLGQPLDEATVHRPERVAALSGLAPGERITAEAVARVLLHSEGGRKGVPAAARWLPVLNKAEPGRLAPAERIAELLLAGGAEAVVLTTAAASDPAVAVLRPGHARP